MAPTPGDSRQLLVFTAEHLLNGYGSSTALRTFISAVLQFSNWRVTVVEPEPGAAAAASSDGRIDSIPIRIKGVAGRRAELLRYARASRSVLTSLTARPDVVISWQPLPAAFGGSLASKALGVPHLVRTCGPELARSWSRFPNTTSVLMPLTTRVLQRADAVIVKSALEYRLLDGYRLRKVIVIPNGVDHRQFAMPRMPTNGHVTRLLAVCQLESHKGVAMLLSALAGLTNRLPRRWQLTIVGDGSQRHSLEGLNRRLGVRATFLGRLPHAELPALYATHDALVLPSQVEGCSNAALEAMASGLPIVGMRSALGDLVEDGVSGVLADSPDRSGLEDALGRILDGTPTTRSMGEAARMRAVTHTPKRLFHSYQNLIDGLCGKRDSHVRADTSRVEP